MTGGVRRVFLDDRWIEGHWNGSEVAALCRDYNAAHGTEYDRCWFNYYVKRWLNLKTRGRKYTAAEREWLSVNYPDLGAAECAKEFCLKFGRQIKPDTLRRYCSQHLGVKRDMDKRYQGSAIGTLSVNCRGEAKIKTENGWVKATHCYVDVPNGAVAFNLDRDIYNNAPENIGITTNSNFRKMRNYGFWSQDREITKTGLLCCELETLIQQEAK